MNICKHKVKTQKESPTDDTKLGYQCRNTRAMNQDENRSQIFTEMSERNIRVKGRWFDIVANEHVLFPPGSLIFYNFKTLNYGKILI